MSNEAVARSVTGGSIAVRLGGQQAHGAQMLHQLAHVAEYGVVILAVRFGELTGDGNVGPGPVEQVPDAGGRMVQDVRLTVRRGIEDKLVVERIRGDAR